MQAQINGRALTGLVKRFKAEADGKQYRKDLVANLKQALAPPVAAVQGKLRGMPHASRSKSSPPLGSYLASKVKPQVRTAARGAGAKVRIPQTPNLRGFKLAARRLNRKSWRHKVFGTDKWVTQESPMPEYFDQTLADDAPQYRRAVVDAIQKAAGRLSR